MQSPPPASAHPPIVLVRVIEAKELPLLQSPLYFDIKLKSQPEDTFTSKEFPPATDPRWDELFTFKAHDVENELVQIRIFEIDHMTEPIGEVEVPLLHFQRTHPDQPQPLHDEWRQLTEKKAGFLRTVQGQLHIRIHVGHLDSGSVNAPPPLYSTSSQGFSFDSPTPPSAHSPSPYLPPSHLEPSPYSAPSPYTSSPFSPSLSAYSQYPSSPYALNSAATIPTSLSAYATTHHPASPPPAAAAPGSDYYQYYQQYYDYYNQQQQPTTSSALNPASVAAAVAAIFPTSPGTPSSHTKPTATTPGDPRLAFGAKHSGYSGYK